MLSLHIQVEPVLKPIDTPSKYKFIFHKALSSASPSSLLKLPNDNTVKTTSEMLKFINCKRLVSSAYTRCAWNEVLLLNITSSEYCKKLLQAVFNTITAPDFILSTSELPIFFY